MNIKIKRILSKYLENTFIAGFILLLIFIFKNKIPYGYIFLIFMTLYLTKDLVFKKRSLFKKIFGLKIVNENDTNVKVYKLILREIFEIIVIDTALILIYNKGVSDLLLNIKVVSDRQEEKPSNIGLSIVGLFISFVLLITIIVMIYFITIKLDYFDDYTYYEEYKPSYNYKKDKSLNDELYEYKLYRKITEDKLNIYDEIKFEDKKDENIEKEVDKFYKKNKIDNYFKIDFTKEYTHYYHEGEKSNLIILYFKDDKKLFVIEYTKIND